jgi:hypothetical protein
MNQRVILILWMVAIALQLYAHYNSYLRTKIWFRHSLADKHLQILLFSGMLIHYISFLPTINEQIIKLRRNL